MTRLLIADDHPLYRLALAQAVRGVLPGATIDEAEDLPGVQAALAAHPDTDLVLLDLHMPGSHGLVGLASLRAEFPGVAVAMISAHEDPATIRRALAYGDMGSSLNPTGGTWWSLPTTLTQSLVYLGAAWWLARRMGLTNRTDPAVLAAPQRRV